MLDQRQLADRAMAAKDEFVDKRDKRWTLDTFWKNFAQMYLKRYKKIFSF